MSGPFPGMDPYLEDSTHWTGVHDRLIYCLGAALNASLPEGYVAEIEERLIVSESTDIIIPDLVTLRNPMHSNGRSQYSGGTLLLEKEDMPKMLTLLPDEERESYLVIRPASGQGEVVTVIEILSPTNKMPGHAGRRSYFEKQEEVFRISIHLLEIDLLRKGVYTVAPPKTQIEAEYGTWDYIISLNRAESRRNYELWLVSVRQRLPRIRVPLRNGESDILIDLQSILDRVYEEGPYRRRIDYSCPPAVPLAPPDDKWADSLLMEKGLRPTSTEQIV